MQFNYKKVLLVGFAREGQATLRFLQANAPQTGISVCDSNYVPNDLPHAIRQYNGPNYLLDAAKENYDVILRSPGIPPQRIKEFFPDTTIKTATSLFLEYAPGTVIGITGTKGKSTTASLIAHLLLTQYKDVRLVGNIGKPALDYLAGATAETFFVCELSSFQLEDVTHSPSTAVLLPIVPEHLDHHGSYKKYTEAKYNIFKFQSGKNSLIVNRKFLPFDVELSPTKVVPVADVSAWRNEELYLHGQPTGVFVKQLKIRGQGALENICYAVTAANDLGVPTELVAKALPTFEPLPHRLEIIGERNGVTYVNDSLCTVPEAMINALNAFHGQVQVLIAGGHDRGIEYDVVGPALAAANLKRIILFHGTGEKIKAVALAAHVSSEVIFVNSMQKAVALAAESATSGSVVLMSPASSSFGLFKDYADRGDQFRKAVGLIEQS